MFSIDNFYYILYTNLLKPVKLRPYSFSPFGTTSLHNLQEGYGLIPNYVSKNFNLTLFYDQEPLVESFFYKLIKSEFYSFKFFKILANSEHSDLKKKICRDQRFYDWYYFFHGFAALDWYRDFQFYSSNEHSFSKVFMSLNRSVIADRSYRLLLVSNLISKNLLPYGHVSLILKDHGLGTWQDELVDPHSKLPENSKEFIKNTISQLTNSLTVDQIDPPGHASADCGYHAYRLNCSAFWHIVSETIFYEKKLHLTEKIFKPIVSRRPFILVAAPGNLQYLKSYGFKTFDKWIDESYDYETDNELRLFKITDEIEKLTKLSKSQQLEMFSDMQEILEYNFQHFFNTFKEIIVKELLTNYQQCILQFNNARVDDRAIPMENIDFTKVQKLLLQ